jgi:WD40 repeat protein
VNNKWVMEVLVGPRTSYNVYSIAVNNDGTLLAAGGLAYGDATANVLELYDLRNMAAGPKRIPGYSYDIENVYFTADGKGIFARDNSGHSIKYSDLSTAKEIINSKEKINNITLSPNGAWIAGAGDEGSLYLWDTRNNYASKVLYKNPKNGKGFAGLTAVGFSRDGKSIVVGDVDGIIRVISPETGNVTRTLTGHTSGIEQIVFNTKGSFMATASDDKTVRLWNMDPKRLREQPIVLSGHADWVRTAVFSADDEQLLAGMHSNAEKANETIHAWPTKIETMSGLLCAYLKRNLTEDEWATYVDADLKREITCENAEGKK